MELTTGNVFINEDDLIHAFVKASTEIDTYVKGYHVYKNIQKPTVNQELETEMEPDNVMNKYAVCVKKKTCKWGIYLLAKTVNLTKYFISSEQTKMQNAKLS